MSRTIVIDPVTRIEGHSKITIQLDDRGEVGDAGLHVTPVRGCERITQGRQAPEERARSAAVGAEREGAVRVGDRTHRVGVRGGVETSEQRRVDGEPIEGLFHERPYRAFAEARLAVEHASERAGGRSRSHGAAKM